MINQQGTFIAEIRNINDPYASGRYQIRIYGNHNNEQTIIDEHLPWAHFLQHAGSAGTSKIGMLPTGPIVGSRVYGVFLDEAKQYPIILGTFPRGAMLQSSNADVGQTGLDPQSNGIDTPVINGSANGNFGLTPNAPGLGGTAVNPLNAQFNQAPFVNNTQGQQGANTARQMHAPNADQPTIAGVSPTTNLPSALQQVGSNAQVLPMMINLLSQVQSMMNMNNSAGSNSDNPISSPTPASDNLSGLSSSLGIAFGKILIRIAYHLGFDYTVNVLSQTFSYDYDHIWNLDPRYQAPVLQGILLFIQNYASYTQQQNDSFIPSTNILSTTSISNNNITIANTVSKYTNINVLVVDPPLKAPQPLVQAVPNYYIQKYYIVEYDPHPGYIQWLGPSGNYVYTVRTPNDPNYGSSTDGITALMKVQMYDLLFPYFQQGFLTAAYINEALNIAYNNAQTAATESILGMNSSSNILASAIAILGEIGSMIISANTEHLPNSVLNQQSMSNTLNSFTTNIGALQQMKNISNTAFNPSGILGMLSSLIDSNEISTSSSGSLSTLTSDYLTNSGIDTQYIQSLNNITTNNFVITTNAISTIASVTLQLQNANAASNIITDVQILLSEIIVPNTTLSEAVLEGINQTTVTPSQPVVTTNTIIIANTGSNTITISNTGTNTVIISNTSLQPPNNVILTSNSTTVVYESDDVNNEANSLANPQDQPVNTILIL